MSEFPVVHDIQYVNGIRVTRTGNLWLCPHENMLGANPELVAQHCSHYCEPHPTDVGYPLNDPCHPEYHSLHADWYDLRDRG